MSQFSIFMIRAILGLALSAIVVRFFHGSINPAYVAGLTIIVVGLAYFSEYLRKRRTK